MRRSLNRGAHFAYISMFKRDFGFSLRAGKVNRSGGALLGGLGTTWEPFAPAKLCPSPFVCFSSIIQLARRMSSLEIIRITPSLTGLLSIGVGFVELFCHLDERRVSASGGNLLKK